MPQLGKDKQWKHKDRYVRRNGPVKEHRQRYGGKRYVVIGHNGRTEVEASYRTRLEAQRRIKQMRKQRKEDEKIGYPKFLTDRKYVLSDLPADEPEVAKQSESRSDHFTIAYDLLNDEGMGEMQLRLYVLALEEGDKEFHKRVTHFTPYTDQEVEMLKDRTKQIGKEKGLILDSGDLRERITLLEKDKKLLHDELIVLRRAKRKAITQQDLDYLEKEIKEVDMLHGVASQDLEFYEEVWKIRVSKMP